MANMRTNDWILQYVKRIVNQAMKDWLEYDENYIIKQCVEQYEQEWKTIKNEDWSYSTEYSYHIFLTK